jgi:hypothetical protein
LSFFLKTLIGGALATDENQPAEKIEAKAWIVRILTSTAEKAKRTGFNQISSKIGARSFD